MEFSDFENEDSDAPNEELESYLYSLIHFENNESEPASLNDTSAQIKQDPVAPITFSEAEKRKRRKRSSLNQPDVEEVNLNSFLSKKKYTKGHFDSLKKTANLSLDRINDSSLRFSSLLCPSSETKTDKDADSLDEEIPVLDYKDADCSSLIGPNEVVSSSIELMNIQPATPVMKSTPHRAFIRNEVLSSQSSEESDSTSSDIDSSVQLINSTANKSTKSIDAWNVSLDCITSKATGSRYYDGNFTVCDICLKKGHLTSACTRTGPVCILCGIEGHVHANCPNAYCHACYAPGHTINKCARFKFLNRTTCVRCGSLGHDKTLCSDQWRQYHATVKPGPPVRPKKHLSRFIKIACSNCAKPGHHSHDCRKSQPRYRLITKQIYRTILHYDKRDIYERKPTRRERISLKHTLKSEVPQKNSRFSKNRFSIAVNKESPSTSTSQAPLKSSSDENEEMVTRRNKQRKRKALSTKPSDAGNSELVNTRRLLKAINLSNVHSDVLRSLFPEKTEGRPLLSKNLKRGLRRKLKYFLSHGYVPGDEGESIQRMEEWLYSVADGEALTFKRRWRLLDSVSAALHNIGPRVSDSTPPKVEEPPPRSGMKRKVNLRDNRVTISIEQNQVQRDYLAPESLIDLTVEEPETRQPKKKKSRKQKWTQMRKRLQKREAMNNSRTESVDNSSDVIITGTSNVGSTVSNS